MRVWAAGVALAFATVFVSCSSGGASDGGIDAMHFVTTSPGSVTLRLVIPTDKSFCDQTDGCGGVGHISIVTETGATIATGTPWCSTICSSTCQPSPCPGIACIPQGMPVKTMEFKWDGAAVSQSTCGNKMTCYQPGFVKAGHYVARMCATPGTIIPSDGGLPTCTATGPVECVEVPFDIPGSSTVEGTLP